MVITSPRPAVASPAATGQSAVGPEPAIPSAQRPADSARISLQLPDCWELSDENMRELNRLNQLLRFEVWPGRELIIMSGEGAATSNLGAELIADCALWNRASRGGSVYGPTGTVRFEDEDGVVEMAPDVSWVSEERLSVAPETHTGVLLATCPDFLIEVRSRYDSVAEQQRKMDLWMQRGTRLGWLVDPQLETVWIYRPSAEPERLERPNELSGEDVCDGLIINFAQYWTEPSPETE